MHILVEAFPRENPEEEGPTVEENIRPTPNPIAEMVKKRTMTLERWFLDAPTSGGQVSSQSVPQHTAPPVPKQQRKRHKGAGGAVT